MSVGSLRLQKHTHIQTACFIFWVSYLGYLWVPEAGRTRLGLCSSLAFRLQLSLWQNLLQSLPNPETKPCVFWVRTLKRPLWPGAWSLPWRHCGWGWGPSSIPWSPLHFLPARGACSIFSTEAHCTLHTSFPRLPRLIPSPSCSLGHRLLSSLHASSPHPGRPRGCPPRLPPAAPPWARLPPSPASASPCPPTLLTLVACFPPGDLGQP